MHTKATALWTGLCVVLCFAGCSQIQHGSNVNTANNEGSVPVDSQVGVWHLDGETILAHDLKACGKSEIGENQKEELLPLANELGTRYTLVMKSDGSWEFSSILNGDIDDKEKDIFTALTGEKTTTDFYYANRFPNHRKSPCNGTWTWTKSDGLRHSGFDGYPVENPGPIVIDEKTMTFVDGQSQQIMIFTYVGRYRHDPDPKYR